MAFSIFLTVTNELNDLILKEKKLLGYTTRQEVIKHVLINELNKK